MVNVQKATWINHCLEGHAMGFLSDQELARLQPAESVLFPSPIPVQSVSSDEFMPARQTPKQREFEARVKSLGASLAKHLISGKREEGAKPDELSSKQPRAWRLPSSQ